MIQLEIEKRLFTDLVKNLDLFNEYYPKEELSKLPDWEDDSDYSNFPHIDDLLASIDEEDINTKIWHTVRVPDDYILSSEKSEDGSDRPKDQTKKPAYRAKHKKCLSTELKGRMKGYRSIDAKQLMGMLRYHEESGKWQLVKFVGNGRFIMKKLANRGASTEYLMSICFHDKTLTHEEMKSFEAEAHITDAGDVSSQNENQKHISGLTAGRDEQVYTFKWMRENDFDYVKEGVSTMKHEGVFKDYYEEALDNGMTEEEAKKYTQDYQDNFVVLHSLSGIKDGDGNGFFKKYGADNMKYASDTVKRLLKITKEYQKPDFELYTSVFETVSLSYKLYAVKAFLTVAQLDLFWDTLYQECNNGQLISRPLFVNDLSKTGGVKDIPYILAEVIWPALFNFYVQIKEAERKGKKGQKSVRRPGASHEIVRKHLDLTKDARLAKDMRNFI